MPKINKFYFDSNEKNDTVRINRFLSDAGICSRREADEYILAGRVLIDGVKAEIGNQVNKEQEVLFDGKVVLREIKLNLIAFNKPFGIVCTTDRSEPDNIIDYIQYDSRIYPIGRLDKDSEGLILLTNNGDIVNKILRAGNNHEKEYIVEVNKAITHEFLKEMSTGVPILNTVTKPCFIEAINRTSFRIILTQGLNRQIRRMCEYLDYRVTSLTRVRIMNIELGRLKTGGYRNLTESELEELNQMIEASSDNTKDEKEIIYKKKDNYMAINKNYSGKKTQKNKNMIDKTSKPVNDIKKPFYKNEWNKDRDKKKTEYNNRWSDDRDVRDDRSDRKPTVKKEWGRDRDDRSDRRPAEKKEWSRDRDDRSDRKPAIKKEWSRDRDDRSDRRPAVRKEWSRDRDDRSDRTPTVKKEWSRDRDDRSDRRPTVKKEWGRDRDNRSDRKPAVKKEWGRDRDNRSDRKPAVKKEWSRDRDDRSDRKPAVKKEWSRDRDDKKPSYNAGYSSEKKSKGKRYSGGTDMNKNKPSGFKGNKDNNHNKFNDFKGSSYSNNAKGKDNGKKATAYKRTGRSPK